MCDSVTTWSATQPFNCSGTFSCFAMFCFRQMLCLEKYLHLLYFWTNIPCPPYGIRFLLGGEGESFEDIPQCIVLKSNIFIFISLFSYENVTVLALFFSAVSCKKIADFFLPVGHCQNFGIRSDLMIHMLWSIY